MRYNVIPRNLQNKDTPFSHYTASTTPTLGFSICVVPPNIGIRVVDGVQLTLALIMFLLVVVQFVKESLQMYKATNRYQLNPYMNLLVREEMLYFLAYVRFSSFSSSVTLD